MLSMKFYNVQQGSAEWYRLRLGRPTSSQFHRIVTAKGEPSRQAVPYLYRLVAERLLNETLDDDIGFVSYVRDGKEREPQAVALFNFMNEVELQPGGFITTNDGRLGASPDRMLKGMKEGVEVKCPAPQTQIKYLLDGPGDDYRPQVQGHLLVADSFQAVHFYTYHPQMPPFHKVTVPDRHYQVALRGALNAFCDALEVMYERAKGLGSYVVTRSAITPEEHAYGEPPLQIINPEVGGSDGA
jgi:hypothetical protein